MNVDVIVAVSVIDAVVVAALVNGNATVGVIDAVDDVMRVDALIDPDL